ncbi:F-box protein At2g16450-like [Papaver somniferum]|uniref:F-box protein At2g16450-like n=1 Tax=Papaver somniferum TaxID=3469 RepID=UPI000E703BBA|nr:F-box protein At2g16450-like [Papaver somniferum]
MHINCHTHYVDPGKLSFIGFADNQLYYFEYIENHETPLGRIREITLKSPFKCHNLVGSFNGLLCLKGPKQRFCICNPITKEYVILPEPVRKYDYNKYRWTGFGYLPSIGEYKVVLVCYEERHFVYVMVYTLASGNGWRNIGKFNLEFDHGCYEPGIFVDGALHWKDRDRKMIIVFDMADEKFRESLSLPVDKRNYHNLGVFDGLLYYVVVFFDSVVNHWCSDIWMHKKKNTNYDRKEQTTLDWSKEFTVATSDSTPLAVTKTGGILGCASYCPWYLHIYDPKASASIRRVDFQVRFCQVIPYKNTLVSLKELEEEGTIIMQLVKKRKRRANSWS